LSDLYFLVLSSFACSYVSQLPEGREFTTKLHSEN
jgi:hypothetical protein